MIVEILQAVGLLFGGALITAPVRGLLEYWGMKTNSFFATHVPGFLDESDGQAAPGTLLLCHLFMVVCLALLILGVNWVTGMWLHEITWGQPYITRLVVLLTGASLWGAFMTGLVDVKLTLWAIIRMHIFHVLVGVCGPVLFILVALITWGQPYITRLLVLLTSVSLWGAFMTGLVDVKLSSENSTLWAIIRMHIFHVLTGVCGPGLFLLVALRGVAINFVSVVSGIDFSWWYTLFVSAEQPTRILIVEDSSARIDIFKEQYPHAEVIGRAHEAIECLTVNTYDVLFLDHDLGASRGTGSDITGWLSQPGNQTLAPQVIVLHSHNPKGRGAMKRDLERTSACVIEWVFSTDVPTLAALFSLCEQG